MIYQPVINRPVLPDPADDKILECAISSNAKYIVTFNIGHFLKPILAEYSIKAILPKTCLKKERLK